MQMWMAVGLGGSLGAIGRYYMSGYVMRMAGSSFPWGTLAVNVVGALAMGFLVEALALKFSLSPVWRAFLTVGLLGGFTTFSAFSLEVVLLMERNAHGQAAIYALASVILSVGALFAGLYLGRVVVA